MLFPIELLLSSGDGKGTNTQGSSCYCAQYNTPEAARTMWNMLTKASARVFDPEMKYGIEVGNDADLNLVEAPNVHDAIRTRASRPYIIRHGKVIASFIRRAQLL